jgi:hypothetical protein
VRWLALPSSRLACFTFVGLGNDVVVHRDTSEGLTGSDARLLALGCGSRRRRGGGDRWGIVLLGVVRVLVPSRRAYY